MTKFTGMDIAAVRNLSTQLDTSAQQIRTILQIITSQLNNTAWVGQDQVRFSNDWAGMYTQQLNDVAQGLEDASRLAAQHARQQEQVSG